MTKAEKQILIDKLEELGKAVGYYREDMGVNKDDDSVKKALSEVQSQMALVRDLIIELNVGIDAKEIAALSIHAGRENYKDTHKPAETKPLIIKTPRGTFNIHKVYETEEEARKDGWGLWFDHNEYMILSRDNRVGAVVIRKSRTY